MSKATSYIQPGYQTVSPYLVVKNGLEALEFYKKVFQAKEDCPPYIFDGKLGHAELKIGTSHIMLADENPEHRTTSPLALGGTPVSLVVYVENVDAVVEKAVALGAKLLQPVQDQFYGDRSGMIADPFGHYWCVATHIEDLSSEEINERAAKLHGDKGSCSQ